MSHKKNYPSSNTAKLTKALFTTLCGHTLFTKKHASSKAMFSYLGWCEKVTYKVIPIMHSCIQNFCLSPLALWPQQSHQSHFPGRLAVCCGDEDRPEWSRCLTGAPHTAASNWPTSAMWRKCAVHCWAETITKQSSTATKWAKGERKNQLT